MNSEIISADSMQIYKYMNIGTAKPHPKELATVRHYLIDEVTPDIDFSVVKFKELALGYIKEIASLGKIPIVVGGTGLYINSLIYNIQFANTEVDDNYRKFLQSDLEKYGNQYLFDKLEEIDFESSKKIHINDTKRIIRALEVYKTTGFRISYLKEQSRKNPSEYQFILIGLNLDRQILYERINKRVDNMIRDGLVNEVLELLKTGFNKNSTSMQGIGYKEIVSYLNGEILLDEAIEVIKMESRRLAKRQMTWFKRIEDVIWIDTDKCENVDAITKKAKNCLATYKIIL